MLQKIKILFVCIISLLSNQLLFSSYAGDEASFDHNQNHLCSDLMNDDGSDRNQRQMTHSLRFVVSEGVNNVQAHSQGDRVQIGLLEYENTRLHKEIAVLHQLFRDRQAENVRLHEEVNQLCLLQQEGHNILSNQSEWINFLERKREEHEAWIEIFKDKRRESNSQFSAFEDRIKTLEKRMSKCTCRHQYRSDDSEINTPEVHPFSLAQIHAPTASSSPAAPRALTPVETDNQSLIERERARCFGSLNATPASNHISSALQIMPDREFHLDPTQP